MISKKTSGKLHSYEFARAALTVDAVVFGVANDGLKVLLGRRDDFNPDVPGDEQAFCGLWALPGGFVNVGESPDRAVSRELYEETKVSNIYLEQLYTFGDPDRDPREHVVSIAYLALVRPGDHELSTDGDESDVQEARWFPVDALPDKMAFDHRKIFDLGFRRLKSKVRYAPIGFELLPPEFTIRELQDIYELILERKLDNRLDPRNFRKKIIMSGLLQDTGKKADTVPKATLYRFNKDEYERQTRLGINFEI